MSKELIISSNRHETRVAVVEDDQVVEIFHQRENEYSLAGSIHKGRVTRVLPGMQSAFVDIGLERDAFLYVSDFFEDNDEYDKIVTSVEDKVFKQQSAPPLPPVERSESIAEVSAAEEAPLEGVPPAVASNGAAAAPLQERRDDRGNRGPNDRGPAGDRAPGDRTPGDNDRRGGRGRRRGRGGQRGGGRGLPDSKFYSPRGEGDARPEARSESRPESRETPRTESRETLHTEAPAAYTSPAAAEAGTQADDFLVLPGEKLSKYRHGSEPQIQSPAVSTAIEPQETVEPAEPVSLELEPDDAAEDPVVLVSGSITTSIAESELEPEPELEMNAELAEAVEEAAEDLLAEEDEEAEVAEAIAGEADAMPELAANEAFEGETSDGEPQDELAGEEDEPSADPLEVSGSAEDTEGSGEALAAPDEGPEPARIPTSLTATLREQGGRYPHRVSRRSRRRGRDGRAPEGRGPDGRGPDGRSAEGRGEPGRGPAPEFNQRGAQQETRSVEGRGERPPRPEQSERSAERAAERPIERMAERAPSISDLLREGQEIIVQIAKEPIGQKGARITSHIALPGRFLVYMPTVDHVGVSRKIPSDEERLRLKRILQTHRTGIPGGYIVRTAGDGRTEEELRADMMFLYNLWLDMRQKAERRPAPLLIHHDLNVVERILRDQLTSSFKNIWVDNEELYEAVLSFVQRFQPAMVSRVKMYTRSNPIFDEFGVTAELEKALRPKVWLKSGGYIVINQTEALVAIDINTGKYVGKSNRLEDTIVKTNTDAIKEIVRQIRLRDLGGIIVVDFIDMDERKNRQKVMQALEEAMRADRAPYKILQFNDFGLVAITRKRVKQSLERTLCTPCPYCEGAGSVKSPQTVVGEILQEAHKIAKAVEGTDVMLRVNPEVARLLKSNQNTYLQEVEEILGKTVMVKGDPQLHQEKFDLA